MDYMQEYQKWLDSGVLTSEEAAELEAIRNDPKEIESRFYGPLEFGTAGLRGTMKMGLHQMNVYVIRHATQGFANVICAEGEDARRRGVAIAMDCRNNSMAFARAAAEVCAANGIHVRIFDSLRPTPELSFAVRYYGCQAGINVTASHNPKEYNGYKVYWADGAQLPPHHADAIARELEKVDIFKDIRRKRELAGDDLIFIKQHEQLVAFIGGKRLTEQMMAALMKDDQPFLLMRHLCICPSAAFQRDHLIFIAVQEKHRAEDRSNAAAACPDDLGECRIKSRRHTNVIIIRVR